jgi:hypothetical protein
MVNSVPAVTSSFINQEVIKIDNYEGRKHKPPPGYEPMMTKSRYMGEREEADQNLEAALIYKSIEGGLMKKGENERPLTFGLIRRTEPMTASVEYHEDVKMKNEILTEINTLRKSQ